MKLEAWSPDGRLLAYSRPRGGSAGSQDIWVVPLDGDRKPRAVVQTGFNTINVQFSPDGRWMAYESNDSGRYEVYVQPFPGPGERVPISTAGGAQARWRGDGREIYYVDLDSRLMAVPLRPTGDGRGLEVGSATALFPSRIEGGAIGTGGNRQRYIVTPDGARFLINTAPEEAAPSVTLILNWHPRGAVTAAE